MLLAAKCTSLLLGAGQEGCFPHIPFQLVLSTSARDVGYFGQTIWMV